MISQKNHPRSVALGFALLSFVVVAATASSCDAAPAGHEGACTPYDEEPAAAGVVTTSIHDVPLDDGRAEVSFRHKRDVDPVEDGCVGRVDVSLVAAGTCTIRLQFDTSDTGMTLSFAKFTADSDCPGWLDDEEGLFTSGANPSVTLVGPSELPEENVDEFCLPFELALAGDVELVETDEFTFAPLDGGRTMTMTLDGVTVQGAARSTGNESLRCGE